jgi:sucrose-phosphate synthase
VQHYSWSAHVRKYMRQVRRILGKRHKTRLYTRAKSRLPSVHRFVVCDIDNTLIGDAEGLRELLHRVQETHGEVGLGVATGRTLESSLKVLKEWQVPVPDFLITSVGTEIHYGHGMVEEKAWSNQIDYLWKPEAMREALKGIPGLRFQPRSEQQRFKISYFVDPKKLPSIREIRRHLRRLDLHAKLIYSHRAFLDVVPLRASTGLAIRFLAWRWGLPPEALLVAGDSGNDEEMLSGNTLGVVVGNYSSELERLRGRARIYFADASCAWGILEGIEHYNFFGTVQVPAEE